MTLKTSQVKHNRPDMEAHGFVFAGIRTDAAGNIGEISYGHPLDPANLQVKNGDAWVLAHLSRS
jgi:hypothetical protein